MPRYLSLEERSTYRSLEEVVGCKWSVAVVAALAQGVNRPGQLERYVPGISTKVLMERLRKLGDYGLIERVAHAGAVKHVEYSLTATGRKLASVIGQLRELGAEHDAERNGGAKERAGKFR